VQVRSQPRRVVGNQGARAQELGGRHALGSWIGCESSTSRDVHGHRARGRMAGEVEAVERCGQGCAHGAERLGSGVMPTRGWGWP
jgi:hypothetical protein